MSTPEFVSDFMSEEPINEALFHLASQTYREEGGADAPNLSNSSTIEHPNAMYAVLKNARQEKLAIYRVAKEPSGHGPQYRLSIPRWPEPEYELDPHDHIHALGAISANYTSLESNFSILFDLYSGMPRKTARNLFAKLSNESRVNTIRDALEESDHPKIIKENVEYFLTGFMTIFNARNTLMHAEHGVQVSHAHTNDQLDIPIELYKSPKKRPTESVLYMPTLNELRAIADSARAFREFGSRLLVHIAGQYEIEFMEQLVPPSDNDRLRKEFIDILVEIGETLPDKPPQPVPLNPHSAENPKE